MGTTKTKNLKPLPFFGAFANMAAAGINSANTSFENEKNRRWQEMMYQQQLADQREDTQLAREWQEKMTANDQQWQQKMFDASNEWNSVGAQADRARDAGINPLAALGVSSAGSYSSLSTPSTSTPAASVGNPRTSTPRWGDMISGAIEGYMQDVQAQNIKADTKLKDSQARLTSSKARISEIDEINAKTISNLKVEGLHLDNEATKVSTQFTQLQAAQSAASFGLQMEKLSAEIFQLHSSGMRQVAAAKTDNATRDAKVSQLWSVTRLNLEKELTEGVQRGYIEASTDKVVAETELVGFQKLLTMSQAELNSTYAQLNLTENEIKSIDAEIAKANKDWRAKNERRQGNMKFVTGYVDSLSNLCKNVALCVGSFGIGKVMTRTQTTTNLSTLLKSDGSILSKTDKIIWQ